jgi:hypothetical protein
MKEFPLRCHTHGVILNFSANEIPKKRERSEIESDDDARRRCPKKEGRERGMKNAHTHLFTDVRLSAENAWLQTDAVKYLCRQF